MSALLAGMAAGVAVALALPWRRGPARLRDLSGGEDSGDHPWQILAWLHPPLGHERSPRSIGLSRQDLAPVPAESRRPRRQTAARFTAAERRRHRWASWVVAIGIVLLFGVPEGLVAGAAALIGVRTVLGRLEPASVRRRRERISADLPLAVDLLAACLRSGRPPDEALVVVAQAVGGPLGELLEQVEHRLRLGADPIDAWRRLADEPTCTAFARAVQRALTSGAALAQTLEHVAADVRQERRWNADEQARTVETRSVVPLGLCFLPAFVLVGIVPTIASSLSGVFSLLGP